ncbi:hypothetical protein [Gordonia amicalis]|uniref:hypothetical protein n=1 Tax=Gordonia amicalis TaxID=89053 RepID=UPI001443C03F|nr:hypothetical protein [Gordonia amicalis]
MRNTSITWWRWRTGIPIRHRTCRLLPNVSMTICGCPLSPARATTAAWAASIDSGAGIDKVTKTSRVASFMVGLLALRASFDLFLCFFLGLCDGNSNYRAGDPSQVGVGSKLAANP